MEDTEKREKKVEESSNKLNSLEAEVYTRALNQEVDRFIEHQEKIINKFLTAINVGMISITTLIAAWEILYMLVKGLQM